MVRDGVLGDGHRTDERARTPEASSTPLNIPSRSWDPLHRKDGATFRTAPERPLSHKVSARRPDAVERTSDSDEAKRATTEGAEAQLRVAQNAFRTASDRPQSHKVSAGRSDALKETSESDEGKRATTEGAEAQLRVAQNGLGELLARMHSLQERVARASESDESRDVSGRDVTRGDPLEALAETSLAACLEGVRQVHAQMREACKSVTPGTESERSSATWQQEEPPRGRDVELRALEGVCGEMRADLRKLAERNEALRRVLRCGASGQGGDFAGRSRRGEKEGPACGPTRPCAKCQSLNAKVGCFAIVIFRRKKQVVSGASPVESFGVPAYK